MENFSLRQSFWLLLSCYKWENSGCRVDSVEEGFDCEVLLRIGEAGCVRAKRSLRNRSSVCGCNPEASIHLAVLQATAASNRELCGPIVRGILCCTSTRLEN